MPPHRRVTILLIGLWMICAVLAVASFLTALRLGTIRMSGSPTTWDTVRSQITPWVAVMIVTPALVWWSRRFPPVWRVSSIVGHAAALLVFAGIYLLLNILVSALAQARRPVMPEASALGGRIMSSAVLITAKYTIVVAATTAALSIAEARRRAEEAVQLERSRAELARDLTTAKLHALRTQLQPHFLFNALNAVSGMIDDDGPGARRALARIGDLLRMVLDRTERATLTLGEELDLTDRYVAIERLRLGERLRVSYDIPDDLLGVTIPSFAIQPLVENAIRHGISRRLEGGAVEVTARRRAAALELRVTNDMDPVARVGPERIGLGTLRARIAATYGPGVALDAGPRPDGRFSVVLAIPCE